MQYTISYFAFIIIIIIIGLFGIWKILLLAITRVGDTQCIEKTAWKPKNLIFFPKNSNLHLYFGLCWRAEINLASSKSVLH